MGWGLGVAHLRDLFCVIYRPVLSNFLFPSVFLTNTFHVLSIQNRVPCREIIPLGKVKFVLKSQFQQNIVYTVSIYYNYLIGNTMFYGGTATHIRKLEGPMLELKKTSNVFDNKIIRTFPFRQANTKVILQSPV